MQEKCKLISRKDGLEISVLIVSPEAEVKESFRGVVQIVHGMSEYKERYLPLMEFLAINGYVSIIHDHRGHGESVKSEADYGYMYEAGTDALLDDILLINDFAKEKFPGMQVIMFAHSMGSLAARSLMREYDKCVDGLILSGAPCKNAAVDAAISLTRLQKKVYGSRHVSKLLQTMSFMAYVKRFAHEKSEFAWVCSDPAVVAAYDEDPKCGFTFTVDGFQTLFELMKRTYTKTGWKCENPRLPILFLAGADDPCVESPVRFDEELQYMNMAGYTDVQGILYDGMRHEICNEPENQKVFDDIIAFLEKKCV